MKFLLVLALALVAASAEEQKEVKLPILPYAYAASPYYNNYYPGFYNNFYNYQPYAYNPVQIKPVAKEFEVQVKKIEFVEPETACKNAQGALVPCHKAKRSAEEEEEKPKAVLPLAYPYAAYPYAAYPYFNNYYNTYPLAYNYPVVHTAAGCQNYLGQLVACNYNKRSADEEPEMMMKEEEEKKAAVLPLAYPYAAYPYAAYPYFNNYYNNYYNAYPLTYTNAYTTTYTAPYTYSYYTHALAKRSAEEEAEKPKTVLPLAYNYAAYPYFNNYYYNSYPLTYTTPVAYKAPEPVVHEVPYYKPVYKEVVEKVELQPLCYNSFGLAVNCAHTE